MQQAQLGRVELDPALRAKGRALVDAGAKRGQVFAALRNAQKRKPVSWPLHRPVAKGLALFVGRSLPGKKCLTLSRCPKPRARPLPVLGPRAKLRAHGIAFDVAQHGQQMLAALRGEGLEAALPDMPGGLVSLAMSRNMGGQKPVHEAAKVAVLARPETEMKVVGHQAVGKDAHLYASAGLVEQDHECGIIVGGMENAISRVTAIDDVIA